MTTRVGVGPDVTVTRVGAMRVAEAHEEQAGQCATTVGTAAEALAVMTGVTTGARVLAAVTVADPLVVGSTGTANSVVALVSLPRLRGFPSRGSRTVSPARSSTGRCTTSCAR